VLEVLSAAFFIAVVWWVLRTSRDPVKILELQKHQLSYPIRTWLAIAGLVGAAALCTALGVGIMIFGSSFGWSIFPTAAYLLVIAAFLVKVWTLPVPAVEVLLGDDWAYRAEIERHEREQTED